jgi:hypothetical protein
MYSGGYDDPHKTLLQVAAKPIPLGRTFYSGCTYFAYILTFQFLKTGKGCQNKRQPLQYASRVKVDMQLAAEL